MNTSKNKKKILVTLNDCRISGIEKFTILLAKHIDRNRFKITVAVPTYGPVCEVLKKLNTEYFVFNNKKNGKYRLSGIRDLFKFIKENNFDIIHAQAGSAPCLIGKMLGTKLILEHRHGIDYTIEQIENLSFLKLQYEKMKKNLTDYTLTCNRNDKNILINKLSYESDKIGVIYNGIEHEEKPEIRNTNIKFIIGNIGRLMFQKGQEYLIEAALILRNKGYDFEYHIYGEGEKKDELSNLIKRHKLEDTVFLKGYNNDIYSRLKSFDIFALPSRYEGIPYVILEAMKASVPVIATEVGGINEVIMNMINGILIQKEDPNQLAASILKLYDSEKLRNDFTIQARKDFIEKYTIEKTIEEVEYIYSTGKLNLQS
ncbi:MAG: glycosyltransferase family 4 protein [Ignavibacteria bacterium]|nr:glycosyltransferase family 4 protein [Ignavibacteria bacterium]